ncbi:hypothetical protein ACE6H2_023361 [Prunus campanulata]
MTNTSFGFLNMYGFVTTWNQACRLSTNSYQRARSNSTTQIPKVFPEQRVKFKTIKIFLSFSASWMRQWELCAL